MEVVREFTWTSDEASAWGTLKAVGCDTHGNVYVAAGNDLYQMIEKELNFVRKLADESAHDEPFEVFTLAFDKTDRFYIASNWFGLQVFADVKKTEENDTDLLFSLPDWFGPFSLSHPSGQLCGVNYKESETGVMSFINWNAETEEFKVKPWPAWGDDMGDWLMTGRDPTYSIRRAWYPDRIMIYLVDKLSYTCPMDGLRSLHMMFAPDGRNIKYLNHTFLSCPWDSELEMPFTAEIPHKEVSSELLLFTPRGVITERGQHFLDFEEYEDESTYTKAFSATDFEGMGSRRTNYVLGLTTSEHKNSVRVIVVQRNDSDTK
uniref:Uncharacterized protein n=1 Tax=Vannella robusta TaxID=1487602 RepID=A0A7S4HTD4_9EUKA|mmetsp:Transcript_15390/g.19576  ORF Transcript_15390/g.19576 Transcript_15390/m.19576 type:complete len:319 (+) Transcript_15390:1-957(+)